jgi:hypothetical protein
VADPQPAISSDRRARAISGDRAGTPRRQLAPSLPHRVEQPQVAEEGRRIGLAGEHDQAQTIDPRGLMAESGVGSRATGLEPAPARTGEVERVEIAVDPRAVAAAEQVRGRAGIVHRPRVILASARDHATGLDP